MAGLRNAWNELVRRSPSNEVFSTYDWLTAWISSGARKAVPHVTVVFHEDAPAAIAPLMMTTRQVCGVSLRSLEFLGSPHSDYSDFIYSDESLIPVLWNAVEGSAAKADLVFLQQIKETSPTWEFLKSRRSVAVRPCVIGLSGALPKTPAPDISECLKRPGLRPRALRRIEKEGKVELNVYDQPAEIAARLPVLFSQHIRRWADTSTPSFFRDESIQQMYRHFAGHMPGVAMLAILTLDEAPVACLFGFKHARKLVVHTLAYDPDYSRYQCGLVCIVKVMQSMGNGGVDVIDFTRGTENYKTFFADIPALSYEVVAMRTPRAKLIYGGFLMAKDLGLNYPAVRGVMRKFGFSPSGVEAEELKKLMAERQVKGGSDMFPAETAKDGICQGQEGAAFTGASTPLRVYRLFWYLRTIGVRKTLQKVASHIRLFVPGADRRPAGQAAPAAVEVPLNLLPGEWVQIKSEQEILATLDDKGRCKGLQLMPQMLRYCGTRARVYKRLEKILFEESQQRRRVRNTVLLENMICDGDGVGCDRSCFFFWREAWLTRAEPPSAEEQRPAVKSAFTILK